MDTPHTFSEKGARRIVEAVRLMESLPGNLPPVPGGFQRHSGLTLVKIGAEVAHPRWQAEEVTLNASGVVIPIPYGARTWGAGAPVVVLGPRPVVGSVLAAFPMAGQYIALGEPPRIVRRITGNTDFGATLWDGSTVGTDEMWEEYEEWNATTLIYERKARKLFGACP